MQIKQQTRLSRLPKWLLFPPSLRPSWCNRVKVISETRAVRSLTICPACLWFHVLLHRLHHHHLLHVRLDVNGAAL